MLLHADITESTNLDVATVTINGYEALSNNNTTGTYTLIVILCVLGQCTIYLKEVAIYFIFKVYEYMKQTLRLAIVI